MRTSISALLISLLVGTGCTTGELPTATGQSADHPHCGIFRAAVESLGRQKLLPTDYNMPEEASVYGVALTLPYPDEPLPTYLDRYFDDLPPHASSQFEEVTLPAGTSYREFDKTDLSDGYAPDCTWYRQGRNWSRDQRFIYRAVLHHPAFSDDGRSAIVTLRFVERLNFGHSVHETVKLRAMCHVRRTRTKWKVRACRPVENLKQQAT